MRKRTSGSGNYSAGPFFRCPGFGTKACAFALRKQILNFPGFWVLGKFFVEAAHACLNAVRRTEGPLVNQAPKVKACSFQRLQCQVFTARGAFCSSELMSAALCKSHLSAEPLAMSAVAEDEVEPIERESVLNGRFVIKKYPCQRGRASWLHFGLGCAPSVAFESALVVSAMQPALLRVHVRCVYL